MVLTIKWVTGSAAFRRFSTAPPEGGTADTTELSRQISLAIFCGRSRMLSYAGPPGSLSILLAKASAHLIYKPSLAVPSCSTPQ
jgi:hypothetical protein